MPRSPATPALKPLTAADLQRRVAALARNLWWTWNPPARRLLAGLDPAAWEAAGRNPIAALARLPQHRVDALCGDAEFQKLLVECEAQLKSYMSARTWYEKQRGREKPTIAYFSAEYALDDSLPQYAGGLGVLAGDHLKSASDLGIPLVAVGLLYRNGYYQQQLAPDGSTRVSYPQYDYSLLPIEDTGKTVDVPVAARSVRCRIWRVTVGRVRLHLLDSDLPGRPAADRAITQQLYGGDGETRIQQEILLGVGGVLALQKLGIRATVFHLNEGHAAFSALERLRQLRAKKMPLEQAIEAVRNSTVFTTHTPVPAGHDRFDEKTMTRYLGRQMSPIDAGWLDLGREKAGDRKEPLCMTVLAIRLSRLRNGVSQLHGEVSRDMWRSLLDSNNPENTIGHITNGIHSETWLAPEARALYEKYLKPEWVGAGPGDDWWSRAERVPPAELWSMRNLLRARMIQYIRSKLRGQILRRFGSTAELSAAYEMLDENTLTIGFARRFATYKRAPLLFRDLKRISAIASDAKRPVQFVFAGKAHPRDLGGQAFATEVFRRAGDAGLRGRVVLLENYGMQMGAMLTSGCDVWLNNPIRPQEASGTSGMKPPLHGGINCSILDGWWPEAYDKTNGWAIGDGRQLKKQSEQDKYDAECIYELLEREIVPEFYNRDADGVPRDWAKRMARSMATVCATFSTARMVSDYYDKYYEPTHRRAAREAAAT